MVKLIIKLLSVIRPAKTKEESIARAAKLMKIDDKPGMFSEKDLKEYYTQQMAQDNAEQMFNRWRNNRG